MNQIIFINLLGHSRIKILLWPSFFGEGVGKDIVGGGGVEFVGHRIE